MGVKNIPGVAKKKNNLKDFTHFAKGGSVAAWIGNPT